MRVPAARLQDALEDFTGDRLVGVLAHVPARPDGIPRLHVIVLSHGHLAPHPAFGQQRLQHRLRAALIARSSASPSAGSARWLGGTTRADHPDMSPVISHARQLEAAPDRRLRALITNHWATERIRPVGSLRDRLPTRRERRPGRAPARRPAGELQGEERVAWELGQVFRLRLRAGVMKTGQVFLSHTSDMARFPEDRSFCSGGTGRGGPYGDGAG